MSSSEELQRLSMVEALPRLFSGGDSASIEKVVPKLQEALPGNGAEFHMIASNTFKTILEQDLVPPSTFIQTFLSSIVACIDSRDPYISKAWLETLLDIIDLLPQNVVKNDILPVAIARGQLSQSIQCRVTSCELLGKIATKFDCTQIQKELVPLVHSLCQDVCGEVRGSMCHQLQYIARGLSPEAVKPALLPLLVELAIDEEPFVRLAAVHTISHLVTVLPGDVLKHTIIPLLQKLCDQSIIEEDRVLYAISEKYGQLCVGLKNLFSENEMSWFISFFRKMAKLGLGKQSSFQDMKNVSEFIREKEHAELLFQCRLNCAYNFPGIAQFAGSVNFEGKLHSTFSALCCDHSYHVRRTMAGAIHEVFIVLGPKCLLLKPELFMLLSDESRDVLQALVPNLSTILDHLTKSGIIGPSITDAITFELLRSLIKCEATLSMTTDWRLHSGMLSQLEAFVKALPSDLVFSHLPAILFHRIQDSRALPCRLAAAHALLIVLRYTSRLENQNEIRNRIFTELCIHHSCHTRLLFVKMCGMALDIFSSFYIKEHFYLRLLSLAGDPVPNVRLVLCGLLPRLNTLLKLPHDSNLLSALQEATERLENAHCPDRDVLDRLKSARSDMESTSSSGLGQDSYDMEDNARYQEEQQIEKRSSISEPRRLVTVNMKTLGEGKRATLVSLQGPDVSRNELRQTSQLASSNNSNISSSIAVSSVGFLGGHVGNESRITASITSTTSESAPSYGAFSHGNKELNSNFGTIPQVKNEQRSVYRSLSPLTKEGTPSCSSLTQIKKEATTPVIKSWPDPLIHGSRLPLPVSPKTNRSYLKPSSKSELSFSNMSDLNVAAVYMLISHINTDAKIPSISTSDGTATSSSSSSSLLSSSYPALFEEEFYIDAGVPLPEKLTVSRMSSSSLVTSDPVSKIPSLRELLFQNSTLLAQVANRAAVTENAAKSLSNVKSYHLSKSMEHTIANDSPNSKRFSRLFEENSSGDFRYSSLINRSTATSLRKDNLGSSSLLRKPTPVRNFQNDNSEISAGQSKDTSPYNSKVLPTTSPRMSIPRNETKIGSINRRSVIFYTNQGNDSEGNNERDRNNVGIMKNGKLDNPVLNHQQSSHEVLELASNKMGNGTAIKLPSRLSSQASAQGARTVAGRNSVAPTKLLATKTSSQEPVNRRHSTLESGDLKSSIGPPISKRFSVGDKSQGSNGSVVKEVSLSSIGVKGVRRSYNSGQRPHSCFIMTQQNDKTNSANSRSMSQESLGMDHNKAGSRIVKRSTVGLSRSENRQSRIPRVGSSCHSSPVNSRSSSPIHGTSAYLSVSHTAPCSARVSRSSSPTEGEPSHVSLASIKLHEPSRLPIRKYNHHL